MESSNTAKLDLTAIGKSILHSLSETLKVPTDISLHTSDIVEPSGFNPKENADRDFSSLYENLHTLPNNIFLEEQETTQTETRENDQTLSSSPDDHTPKEHSYNQNTNLPFASDSSQQSLYSDEINSKNPNSGALEERKVDQRPTTELNNTESKTVKNIYVPDAQQQTVHPKNSTNISQSSGTSISKELDIEKHLSQKKKEKIGQLNSPESPTAQSVELNRNILKSNSLTDSDLQDNDKHNEQRNKATTGEFDGQSNFLSKTNFSEEKQQRKILDNLDNLTSSNSRVSKENINKNQTHSGRKKEAQESAIPKENNSLTDSDRQDYKHNEDRSKTTTKGFNDFTKLFSDNNSSKNETEKQHYRAAIPDDLVNSSSETVLKNSNESRTNFQEPEKTQESTIPKENNSLTDSDRQKSNKNNENRSKTTTKGFNDFTKLFSNNNSFENRIEEKQRADNPSVTSQLKKSSTRECNESDRENRSYSHEKELDGKTKTQEQQNQYRSKTTIGGFNDLAQAFSQTTNSEEQIEANEQNDKHSGSSDCVEKEKNETAELKHGSNQNFSTKTNDNRYQQNVDIENITNTNKESFAPTNGKYEQIREETEGNSVLEKILEKTSREEVVELIRLIKEEVLKEKVQRKESEIEFNAVRKSAGTHSTKSETTNTKKFDFDFVNETESKEKKAIEPSIPFVKRSSAKAQNEGDFYRQRKVLNAGYRRFYGE